MRRDADEMLTFILDSITKIASSYCQTTLLSELAKMCRDIVFADRCTIWVWNKREKRLWTKIADGVPSIEMKDDVGIVGDAIQNNSTEIINDVRNDPRFNDAIDKKTGYCTKTMMVIPMEDQEGKVIGAIQVINKKDNAQFSESDLKYLNLSATYAAESIDRILLFEEIEATQKELIYIMGVTGESRSKETAEHVKRVAEYSWLLGKLYGLKSESCETLKEVSPMHDIGKIGIPDAILNKPGRLDDTERHIMELHSQFGYDILKHSDLPLLKAAAIVAYEHHECYDGSGYPRGLEGEEIHIFARITALADTFDALGSDRIYKKAWKDERIFSLFAKERGKSFEPVLVDLFLDNRKDFLGIRDKYSDTQAYSTQ